MTDRLRAVIAQIEQLPDDEQNTIAARLEAEIADAEWEASLGDPRHHAALDALEAQALKQIAAGEVFDKPGSTT